MWLLGPVGARPHELRVHDVETLARHERAHVRDRAPPPEEVDLERRRVGEARGERDRRRRDAERNDVDAHAERAHRLDVVRVRASEHEGAHGDLVSPREQPEMMVGPDLVAPPRRDREPREQRQDLQELHSFVLRAWIQTPSVAWRR